MPRKSTTQKLRVRLAEIRGIVWGVPLETDEDGYVRVDIEAWEQIMLLAGGKRFNKPDDGLEA